MGVFTERKKKNQGGRPDKCETGTSPPVYGYLVVIGIACSFSAAHKHVRTLNQMHAAGTGQMASEEMR